MEQRIARAMPVNAPSRYMLAASRKLKGNCGAREMAGVPNQANAPTLASFVTRLSKRMQRTVQVNALPLKPVEINVDFRFQALTVVLAAGVFFRTRARVETHTAFLS